jgi:hypothetical protein
MEDAGIDVALMVFWGAPSDHDPKDRMYWSFEGLKPLVEARAQLLRQGRRPPAIGLMYDTSTLANNSWGEHIDLTTDFGRQWFYATIRDFYSCIPARHWAMFDGKPIVLLYAAAFAKNHDPSFVGYTRDHFAADFSGRAPYLAPQDSWNARADSVCAWGGALGLKHSGIAELGPGYDHSAVPGRAPLVVPRENGNFYRRNWEAFLRRPCQFVMIETWNEFHEGTDICESKEYGRQYINLTRQYAALFKRGWTPPPPEGKFKNAPRVEIILGAHPRELGLRLVENADGATAPATVANSEAIRPAGNQSRFIYFAADDAFKWSNAMRARLEVEYFDAAPGRLSVEFDSADASAPHIGAYTPAGRTAHLTGARGWKTALFELRRARFWNSENNAADFRLAIEAPEFYVRRVAVVRE